MPSLYTRLVSGVLFPLQERLKAHTTVAVRRQLEQSQWWSRDRLMAFQSQRLQGLLEHASRHVPYYRQLFAAHGVDAGKVRTGADLAVIPTLTKAIVRANLDTLRADEARDLSRFTTGGSSGEPMIFYIGKERVSHDVAAKWRATRWWGVDIGDPEIVVWGSPIEVGAQDRVRWLRDGILRSELLPAFSMGEKELDGFVERIVRRRPRMVFGYPSAISRIARHAASRGVDLRRCGVRVVFVTSERLYDDQRAAIETSFGCAVANGYGGRDAGFIAHQCPSGGMHITAEDIIVETLDGDGRPAAQGQAGEIVITHLATSDFPFIRYRTGDVGILDDGACDCGRGLPLIREIQGRSTDFVVARDGTVMHGLALIYVLRELPGVESFKIVQESLDHTRVEIQVTDEFPPEGDERVRSGFRQRLGADVNVDVARVTRIEPEKSGKHRYVVSRVHAP